jgi:hypothetical protein
MGVSPNLAEKMEKGGEMLILEKAASPFEFQVRK